MQIVRPVSWIEVEGNHTLLKNGATPVVQYTIMGGGVSCRAAAVRSSLGWGCVAHLHARKLVSCRVSAGSEVKDDRERAERNRSSAACRMATLGVLLCTQPHLSLRQKPS
jgi:hypothetical protein